MRRTTAVALAAAALLVAGGLLGWWVGAVEFPGGDDRQRAVVTLAEPDGATLATVEARVADTRKERIRGLSETESLPNGSGMLFVHPEAGNHSYVMRGMAFPLDIVFVAPCGGCPPGVEGRVTVVHHADVPPPGEDSPLYTGYGRWVLEVPQGYADAVGIDTGVHVRIRYGG